MPNLRTEYPRSFTFFDEWNGAGKFSFALADGSCLYVQVTPTMAALALAQLSEFVGREFTRQCAGVPDACEKTDAAS